MTDIDDLYSIKTAAISLMDHAGRACRNRYLLTKSCASAKSNKPIRSSDGFIKEVTRKRLLHEEVKARTRELLPFVFAYELENNVRCTRELICSDFVCGRIVLIRDGQIIPAAPAELGRRCRLLQGGYAETMRPKYFFGAFNYRRIAGNNKSCER